MKNLRSLSLPLRNYCSWYAEQESLQLLCRAGITVADKPSRNYCSEVCRAEIFGCYMNYLQCFTGGKIPKQSSSFSSPREMVGSSSSSSSSEESATDDFDRKARSCSMALKYSSSILALAKRDWALDFWVRKVCWALESLMVGCSLKDKLGILIVVPKAPHPNPGEKEVCTKTEKMRKSFLRLSRTSSFSSSSSGKTSDSKHVHKFQSKRDETLLLQTDLSKANTVIPKPIQWKDVNLPEEWILEGIAPPAVPKQLEPNTELQNVTQYSDGKVKLSFRRSNSTSVRKKIPEWKLLDSDRTIESEHPPLRSVTIDHGEPPVQIRASPYKIPKPNDSEANLSSIIQQNNFCNTNLNTIGKQLTRIENQFQQSTISVSPSLKPIPSKSDSDKKLKEPIFKPFQVSKTSQRLVHESKSDFAKAIREQLDRIEAASSSSSKVQIAPDTPQSSKIGVLEQDQVSIASSDLEAFTEELVPKANKIQWELALPTSKSPLDLTIDNRPSALNQARYNASSVYEWNIDGMSEYNILGVLQQMTMAANAYKTQSGTSDKAIAEILIAGFTGQLKGWWDHLLTKLQQLDILNAMTS
ncbi:hypothetical protein KPL71_026070 [Citrus sinensis]|uniref:Uncharacterized protein n=1 Tax=Citrus sinensis TaxID=2711 RepID=A0ACB8HX04_CITSI|nr:hypothetical protein KPL71_026070 [Citrus sinensis]